MTTKEAFSTLLPRAQAEYREKSEPSLPSRGDGGGMEKPAHFMGLYGVLHWSSSPTEMLRNFQPEFEDFLLFKRFHVIKKMF